MDMALFSKAIEFLIGVVVVPYLIWITVSIFNQRQEIALLKQSHDDLKDIITELKRYFLRKEI